MTNQEQVQTGEEAEEESAFIKLLTKSKHKIDKMKHIDAKSFAQGFFFPLMVALYEEFDTEFDNVYDNIDDIEQEDGVADALADNPEFLQNIIKYVMWSGAKFDEVFSLAGWIVKNPENKKEMVFADDAPEEARKIYQSVRNAILSVTTEIDEMGEKISSYADSGEGGETENNSENKAPTPPPEKDGGGSSVSDSVSASELEMASSGDDKQSEQSLAPIVGDLQNEEKSDDVEPESEDEKEAE